MPRTLVNIVGGQTQPNILMAKEIHHYIGSLDQLVLVHTQQSQVQADLTQLACAETGATVIMVEVIEDDIIDIQAKLTQQVPIEDEDEIFVNITGGTKIMSIAVYDYFEKYSARILYVALGKNTYNQVFPRVKNKVNNFHYALNLQEYFTGYGVSITNPKSLHKLSRSEEVTTAMFHTSLKFTTQDWERLDLIRQGYKSKSYRGKTIKLGEGEAPEEVELREQIFNFLNTIGFSSNQEGTLDKYETKYLTGDWFEEFVYAQLSPILGLEDTHWGMGLQIGIVKDGIKVDNELDLAIMLRNELHLIECKTRLLTTNGANILTDTLYKADSLRSKFGLNVRAFLFTLADKEELSKGIPRGRLNDITIVTRDEIQEPKMLASLLRL